MSSIFTRIIRRELPSHTVAENDLFIAFLDIRPLAMGHTLVVPKQEKDYLFDYDTTTLSALMPFAKRVAKAIKKCVPCKRVGVAVVGFEVPHAHVHLVPLDRMEDLDFSRPKLTPSKDDFARLAKAISGALPD